MNGTVALRRPTNGAAADQTTTLRLGRCRSFVANAQDRASAQQDPDIGGTPRAATLRRMPRSLLRATLRWLDASVRVVARFFRRPAAPSSSSPATGRPAVRPSMTGKTLGFREFTAPHAFAIGERSRLRVKTTGTSARVMPLRLRSPQ